MNTLLLISMIATPFGPVATPQGRGLHGVDPVDWPAVERERIVASTQWANYATPHGYACEVWRQLQSTTPAWGVVMIGRYLAWLELYYPTDCRLGCSDETPHSTCDIWADDSASPSKFLARYRYDFGATDVNTAVSQYPFPWGRPSVGPWDTPSPVSPGTGQRNAPASTPTHHGPPPVGDAVNVSTDDGATDSAGPSYHTADASLGLVGGLLLLLLVFGSNPPRHA